LLETVDDWILAINDKTYIITAYIYFNEAFDVLCDNKLLYDIAAYLCYRV